MQKFLTEADDRTYLIRKIKRHGGRKTTNIAEIYSQISVGYKHQVTMKLLTDKEDNVNNDSSSSKIFLKFLSEIVTMLYFLNSIVEILFSTFPKPI